VSEHLDEEEPVDVAECPNCGTLTEHEVLRRVQKGEGEDVLVKCHICSKVQTLCLRPSRPVMINSILSDGPDSINTGIESDEDEEISVGDVFVHEDILYKVTRIDDSDSRPAENRIAEEIYTLWAVRCDKTIVRLTMTDGEDSYSSTLECTPDKIFSCGTIMEIDGDRWRIRALHTGKGRTLKGKRAAIDIRRIYLHPPRYRPRGEVREFNASR